jgi:hypothetical protein
MSRPATFSYLLHFDLPVLPLLENAKILLIVFMMGGRVIILATNKKIPRYAAKGNP